MKSILNRYEEILGQMIIYSMSTVTFSPNTSRENKKDVCLQLGIWETQVPDNYLGLPMNIGREKVASFAFLEKSVEQKLQGWTNVSLSKA